MLTCVCTNLIFEEAMKPNLKCLLCFWYLGRGVTL
ncbi:unnamed protein product [Arabidopsis halleri]